MISINISVYKMRIFSVKNIHSYTKLKISLIIYKINSLKLNLLIHYSFLFGLF